MSPKKPLFQLLSEYQPIPERRFFQKMENAPWNQPKKKMAHHSTFFPRLGWQIAVVALLLLTLLSLSIPTVRASISAWLGISIAPSNQMPAVPVNLVAVTHATLTTTLDASTPQPNPSRTATAIAPNAVSDNRPAEISQLDTRAGWRILAPAHLPDGYQFQSVYLDTNQRMVILTYTATRPLPGSTDPTLTETKSITFLQAQRNDFVPLQAAPSAHITDVQIGGQPAAYAIGAWDTEFVKDENDPSGGKMISTWRNDLPVQNLYGQVESIYYVLVTDDPGVSQQDLMDMAASIDK
jgi:hypothetical protein